MVGFLEIIGCGSTKDVITSDEELVADAIKNTNDRIDTLEKLITDLDREINNQTTLEVGSIDANVKEKAAKLKMHLEARREKLKGTVGIPRTKIEALQNAMSESVLLAGIK